MNLIERVVVIDCQGEQIVGILSEPAMPGKVGVLVIVGGPQYRVGSHRQFVLLARSLACEGIPAMRFDCRGMGDAEGQLRSLEEIGPDIAVAIDKMLAECPRVERLVLWGLCDAASAALCHWYVARDPRIAGLVLLNPWVRSPASIARTQIKHYYGKRLLERAFWKKLVRGDVDVVGAVGGIKRSVATAIEHRNDTSAVERNLVYQDRMAEGLRAFPGPVLLILSGRDLTAKVFLDYAQRYPRWSGLLDRPNVVRKDFDEADHTFSSALWRGQVEAATLEWLRRHVVRESR